jgi:hypothetical protein
MYKRLTRIYVCIELTELKTKLNNRILFSFSVDLIKKVNESSSACVCVCSAWQLLFQCCKCIYAYVF